MWGTKKLDSPTAARARSRRRSRCARCGVLDRSPTVHPRRCMRPQASEILSQILVLEEVEEWEVRNES